MNVESECQRMVLNTWIYLPYNSTALCSWLMSFCYPGECLNGTSSCNCSQGFEGEDCLESKWHFFCLPDDSHIPPVTDVPTVMNCQTTISGAPEQSASIMCLNISDLKFVNFLPTQVAATWEAIYLEPNPPPRPPAYVTGFGVGLARLYVESNLYRAASELAPYISRNKSVILHRPECCCFNQHT